MLWVQFNSYHTTRFIRFIQPDGQTFSTEEKGDYERFETSCRDMSHELTLSTTRYYTEQNLSPAIRAKVNEKYPGKKIFGITEVSNSENLTYNIVLEDEKYWYNIESDATGIIKLNKKLEKTE